MQTPAPLKAEPSRPAIAINTGNLITVAEDANCTATHLQDNYKTGLAIARQIPVTGIGNIRNNRNPVSKLSHSFNSIPLHATTASFLQPKLTVSTPGDEYEQEADAVADKIMLMPDETSIQRKCEHCEEEDEEKKQVQRKSITADITPVKTKGAGRSSASPTLNNRINLSRGSGSNIDGNTQSFMSGRFGVDFSNIKIHADNEAAGMNRELNARAFTVGRDIYFNAGEYKPGSGSGKHLLAHELTHVVQQSGSNRMINKDLFIQRSEDKDKAPLAQKDHSARFDDDVKLEKIKTGSETLKEGDSGLAVTKLQQALRELKYFKDIATGYFGKLTKAALIKFQKDKGIAPSGELDADTIKELHTIYDTRQPYLDLAKKSPDRPWTRKLSATDKSAAIAALVPTPHPGAPTTFTEDLGPPKGKYGTRIKAELTRIIADFHKDDFADKEPLRADPAKNFHSWTALEGPAQAAKEVVDKVYDSNYGGAATKPALTHAGGNLIDQWVDEQAVNLPLTDPEKKDKAEGQVRYLIDSNCAAISSEHGAVPSDPAEKLILDPIVESFISDTTKVKTMLEIDVGWEGLSQGGKIYLQRYKSTNPVAASAQEENRFQMWTLFHTCIHEYLHTLAHPDFNAWAKSFDDAGDPTRNNTLVEGLCDFFTINVRQTIVPSTVQATVEGAYANGKPPPSIAAIDPDVYPSNVQAEQLVSIVGIKNAQAAYFGGKVNLIGK